MVDCSQFLEEFCEFQDGLLEQARREELEEHLHGCLSCARYRRVVTDGARLLRDLPEIEPSDDFQARLQHRIFHLEEERSERGRGRSSEVPLSLSLAIAMAIGVAAWTPLSRPRPALVELPPVAAHAPYHVEAVGSLFRAGPLLLSAERASVRAAAYPAQVVPIAVSQPLTFSGPMASRLLFQYSPAGATIVTTAEVLPR